MSSRIKTMLSLIKQSLLDPENTGKKLIALNMVQQAREFSRTMQVNKPSFTGQNSVSKNPLQDYFESDDHKVIWKWLHYFEVYHRHLSVFQNKSPTLLEVGVYGGGSLDMWQTYFNQGSQIIGIDIDESCRHYASENISIHIADQSDRQFWRKLKNSITQIDIVIDDGGHRPGQQIVTLEECLPMLKPGGVYICEDVHGFDNYFLDYIHGLSKSLHSYDEESEFIVKANNLQQHIHSIHLYPYIVVIQINPTDVKRFSAHKKGIEE